MFIEDVSGIDSSGDTYVDYLRIPPPAAGVCVNS